MNNSFINDITPAFTAAINHAIIYYKTAKQHKSLIKIKGNKKPL